MPSNGYKCPDSSEQDPLLTLKFLSSVKLTSKKSKNLSKVLTRNKPHKKMILKRFIVLNTVC